VLPLLSMESVKFRGELKQDTGLQTTRGLANRCRVWASRVTVM
jgi:hypothetical protein